MRRKKYKKVLFVSVVLGFVILYLVIMVFSTYLTKEQFEKEFYMYFYTKVDNMWSMLSNCEETAHADYESGIMYDLYDEKIDDEFYFRRGLESSIQVIDNYSKYQQFSIAAYDYTGEKIAQSMSYIYFYYGNMNSSFFKADDDVFYFELEDYFTEEEKLRLMQYYKEQVTGEKPYSIKPFFHGDTRELARMIVYGGIYEESGASKMTETVYNWKNPDIEDGAPLVSTMEQMIDMNVPGYVQWGEKNYEKWIQDEYLQNYPEYIEGLPAAVDGTYDYATDYVELTEGVTADWTKIFWYETMDGECKPYIIKFRETTHPWLAAMDYLKYVYLAGFLLMAVCITGVVYSANKVYAKREALEKSRRDFTNAIAHEQKTPLGIIRGFAENLKENTIEDKREYYADQIIGQTEEMDKLVREMIDVSKLNSDELVLKNEDIFIKEIFEEQFSKLEMLADEKNLQVCCQIQRNFEMKGNRYYMEKAVWNLISNAIEYNRQDGFINVQIDSDKWNIENSGVQIKEEDLPHVCEIFYTGNKSQNSKERHTGLGLYLAKRIFDMHHLKMRIENTTAGVKVTVTK